MAEVEAASSDVAAVPATDQVVTATPEPVIDAPVEKQAETKSFSQEELDAIVSKRLAREQRKWERERQVATPPPVDVAPADTFESVDAYAEALVAKKLEQRDQLRLQSEAIEQYHDREEEARGKYDDFEQVAYNPNIKITKVMAEAIHSSASGPDVAYYLGSNAKEADRISRLAPLAQAREIGRLEALVAASPPVKKTSTAPEPFTPVTPRSSGSPSFDTTDPRSIQTMTTSEWIAADRARQVKKLAAKKY
jgi:hypothetical protein